MEKERQWLRKRDTKEVFIRTYILAKRDDMIPISEEEAQECITGLKKDQAEHVVEVKKEQEKAAEETAKVQGDGLDQMDDDALKAKAKDIGVFVGKSSRETLIRKIRETLKADAIAMAENKPPKQASEKPA